MRRFLHSRAESAPIGEVDVRRWEQFGLDSTLPFQAMWYTVPPGCSPAPDRHPEVELSLVLSGTASVEIGGEVTDVPAGLRISTAANIGEALRVLKSITDNGGRS